VPLCILENLSKAKSCVSATALFISTLKLKLYASKDGFIKRGPVTTTSIHLFIYLYAYLYVWNGVVCIRFMWQLDWDSIWHQLGDSSCYCAAPWNSGPWATAIPDIYCSPEPSHQSKMLLFQTALRLLLDRPPLAKQTDLIVTKLYLGTIQIPS
jgi:hypothetical protein